MRGRLSILNTPSNKRAFIPFGQTTFTQISFICGTGEAVAVGVDVAVCVGVRV